MANHRYTLAADGTTQLVTVHKPRSLTEYFATLNAYGTFGGGTLSYQLSTNGGVTKTTMKDLSGVAYSTTTADAIDINLGVANHNGAEPIIYAVLTGSTSPAITIDVLDNT